MTQYMYADHIERICDSGRKKVSAKRERASRAARLQHARARAVTKVRLLLFSFAVMILCMTVLSGFSRPHASDYGMTRVYTTVTVGNGDYLWDIAQEYYTVQEGDMRSYIREIENFNGISAEHIVPGQMIVIPYLISSPETVN